MIGDIIKILTSSCGGRANRLAGLPEERIGYPGYRERLFRQNYRLSAAVLPPEGVIESSGTVPGEVWGWTERSELMERSGI